MKSLLWADATSFLLALVAVVAFAEVKERCYTALTAGGLTVGLLGIFLDTWTCLMRWQMCQKAVTDWDKTRTNYCRPSMIS
jgi:membrane-bound metal-dependent hydrolase YbcI (DUF457 family)